ncbi:MAG: sigma-70 family RNA polymerase sigma factor [Acidobacteria bacterium]|nr:sigma-70 family RNA polymerase sigma factor [Acidobacteriota bacterium]
MSSESQEPTDEDLVERTLAGETAAFDTLARRYGRRVMIVASSFFRQMETREDVAQETFLKAFQSLHTYRRGASFERWLTRIAINAAYDQLRRQKRRGEFMLSELTEDESTWLDEALAGKSIEQFRGSERQEAARALTDRLLDMLGAEDRMAMLLMDRDGYTAAEIGMMLGWSRSKVKVRVFRARRMLNNRLARMLESRSGRT